MKQIDTIFKFLKHLPQNATQKEIDRVYKALSLVYHPDLNTERREWAQRNMQYLNEARLIILDPRKREYYLNLLRQQETAARENTYTKGQNVALRKELKQSQEVNGVLGFSLLLLGGLFLLGDSQ